MKNKDNTNSDLEVGKAVGGTAASDSPSRPEIPSTTGCLALLPEEAPKFKYPRRKEIKSVLLRIFRSFNLTKTTTQQKALVLLCVAGAILDPLFFYIPMINMTSKCMKSDRKLAATAISLRSLVDVLHFLLWWWYYSNKWKDAGTSKENLNSLSLRSSKVTGLLVEIPSIIPLPQAVTLAILIIKGSPRSKQAVTLLKFLVLSQFMVRIFRVFPSFQEAKTNSITLLKSRFWIGAGFNLLLFVIASHVLGAFWYLLSAGRLMDCWRRACRNQVGCNINSLYCSGLEGNKSYLDDYCAIRQATNSSPFDFGIYVSALESNIVESTRFPLKLCYCFWWGLRNLSSLGQNLTASAYEWEILFSICISILGLILFSLFIGNMQAFFQYRTNEDLVKMKDKMDKIKKKQRELLKWELFEWLPKDLQDEIILCANESWLESTEVDLRTTLDYLPNDLSKRIKNSIFSKLENKVRLFGVLNTHLPNMFNRMKPEVFTKGSLVFEKGKPIEHMVFVLNGKLSKQIIRGGNMAQDQWVRDFCGEELLIKITQPTENRTTSTVDIKACTEVEASQKQRLAGNCPTSTVDIKASTKVEAFILEAGHLQTLVNKSTALEIWLSIAENLMSVMEHSRAGEDVRKKAGEKSTRLKRSASLKGSSTVDGTP